MVKSCLTIQSVDSDSDACSADSSSAVSSFADDGEFTDRQVQHGSKQTKVEQEEGQPCSSAVSTPPPKRFRTSVASCTPGPAPARAARVLKVPQVLDDLYYTYLPSPWSTLQWSQQLRDAYAAERHERGPQYQWFDIASACSGNASEVFVGQAEVSFASCTLRTLLCYILHIPSNLALRFW